MKKRLEIFTAIALVGILGLMLVPVPSIQINSNIVLAVSTIPDNGFTEVSYSPAFPAVAAVNGGNDTADGTSHTVNLPSGIVAGNLLLVFLASDSNPTITFPSGWTQLFQTVSTTEVIFGAWYRIANGTEGSTITVTTSVYERTAHTSYRITGYSGTPEVGTAATGSNDSPNPPSLTPSWGAKDTLWFAVCGHDYGRTVTVYPTNYTNGQNYYAASNKGCGVGTARRELNAASEDPGTFTLSAADDWVANTIAIQPVVAAPTVTNGVGATNITVNSARLNGNLTSDGGLNCTVHVYWGDNDGATNASNWDTDENLGVKAIGTFYKDVTNLTQNKTYYYRCYANNSAGNDWADSTENFTTLPALPSVDAVVVTASMTPQSQAWVNVTITDNNTLSDLSTVTTVLFYDADGSYTDPGASPTPNNQTLAIMTWYATNNTFVTQSGTSSTWSINNTTSTHPALTGYSGDWKFSFQPGKVATETTGSAKWFARVNATNIANATGSNNNSASGSTMQWYGEITVNTANISWGTVTPGCSNETSPVVNITYICNSNYAEQVKSSATWNGTSTNLTLNTTGSPGAGEFSLKADDDATLVDTVQVLSASYTTFDTGTQTTEAGNAENNNHLWLSLGLGIPVDTYSGTLYFGIAL